MFEDNDIEGWMDSDDLLWLYEQAEQMESVVEVGCWKGRTTIVLLKACPGKVYAVDHFLGSESERDTHHAEAKSKDIYAEFMANVGEFLNLEVLKMESAEAAKQFADGSVDMVFLDNGLSYEETKANIEAWLPKVKKLICGHDTCQEGVRRAVEEAFGEMKEQGAFG